MKYKCNKSWYFFFMMGLLEEIQKLIGGNFDGQILKHCPVCGKSIRITNFRLCIQVLEFISNCIALLSVVECHPIQ